MDDRRVVAQTNRFSAAVRKLLSIKGEEHDVSYGVHLEEERPEYSFLKGERRWAQYTEQASAAGTVALVGVVNPPNSGVLAVVTNVWANVVTASEVRLVVQNTNVFGSSASMHLLDTRFITAAGFGSTTQGVSQAPAGGGGLFIVTAAQCVANVGEDFLTNAGARVPPIILSPGWGCWLHTTPVGVNTLKAMFAGYERSLESGELQP